MPTPLHHTAKEHDELVIFLLICRSGSVKSGSHRGETAHLFFILKDGIQFDGIYF